MRSTCSSSTSTSRYAVDLISEVANLLKFNFTFKWVDDGNYGSKKDDSNEWNGMIGELRSGVRKILFLVMRCWFCCKLSDLWFFWWYFIDMLVLLRVIFDNPGCWFCYNEVIFDILGCWLFYKWYLIFWMLVLLQRRDSISEGWPSNCRPHYQHSQKRCHRLLNAIHEARWSFRYILKGKHEFIESIIQESQSCMWLQRRCLQQWQHSSTHSIRRSGSALASPTSWSRWCCTR